MVLNLGRNSILRIMTTYNDPHMTVTMTEMYASKMVVCHSIKNLTMS